MNLARRLAALALVGLLGLTGCTAGGSKPNPDAPASAGAEGAEPNPATSGDPCAEGPKGAIFVRRTVQHVENGQYTSDGFRMDKEANMEPDEESITADTSRLSSEGIVTFTIATGVNNVKTYAVFNTADGQRPDPPEPKRREVVVKTKPGERLEYASVCGTLRR